MATKRSTYPVGHGTRMRPLANGMATPEPHWKRRKWAALQAEWAKADQRDFNELWTEHPRQRPAADGDARPAADPCPVGRHRRKRGGESR
jgi:hypothetical protein